MLDIKKAYLQVHVSPELARHQAVLWKEKVYLMTTMGFGLAIAPKIMHMIVQWVTRSHPSVDNYVDDIRTPAGETEQVAAELAAYGLPTKPAEPLTKSRVLGMQLRNDDDNDCRTQWTRRDIDLEPPPKLTKRSLFAWCGRLIGHYPICSWLRPACSYLKRLASPEGSAWDDPVSQAAVQSCANLCVYEAC
eukprot:scpid46653/ scgid26524/ 